MQKFTENQNYDRRKKYLGQQLRLKFSFEPNKFWLRVAHEAVTEKVEKTLENQLFL